MPRTPKLKKIEIRWLYSAKQWVAWEGSTLIGQKRSQRELMKAVRDYCETEIRERGVYGFSIRICRKDGTYRDEITIPKAHDPKRSKG